MPILKCAVLYTVYVSISAVSISGQIYVRDQDGKIKDKNDMEEALTKQV